MDWGSEIRKKPIRIEGSKRHRIRIRNTNHRIQVKLVKFFLWSISSTTYVYIKSTTVYVPSSELGLSRPLSRQRVFPSPQNRGGGAHSPAGEGSGESQLQRLEEKLSTLPTL